ncbi:hypothetical protein CALCODRAFT_326686 [Calocera cornea HHB12733]|uniref:Uncharacterized protein n=1 Tax=Calocera cornea HHB12733 TaxID=1353952 RepID=A0A165JGD7_9BASI|nr:hypothetical protein CALCODRAFT_326686 [Calocera cornea HHB12733]
MPLILQEVACDATLIRLQIRRLQPLINTTDQHVLAEQRRFANELHLIPRVVGQLGVTAADSKSCRHRIAGTHKRTGPARFCLRTVGRSGLRTLTVRDAVVIIMCSRLNI